MYIYVYYGDFDPVAWEGSSNGLDLVMGYKLVRSGNLSHN